MNKDLYQAELERYREWYAKSPEFVKKLILKKVNKLKEEFKNKLKEKTVSFKT